jgi:methylenetetrahydrofolate reductase (NADPH)
VKTTSHASKTTSAGPTSHVQIRDLFGGAPTHSFEFFPPKNDEEATVLRATIAELQALHPSFVSVTYRGGTTSRQRTFDLVSSIQASTGSTAMAHLICVGHTRSEITEILANYLDAGVTNIMALGGDVPADPALRGGDFAHASELVAMCRQAGDFSIGVAAHPLGHPLSPSLEQDRYHLAEKLTMADFAVTQFFFAEHEWTSLVDDLHRLGVHKPVLPGIMPVTALSSVERMASMGAAVPDALVTRLVAADARGGKAAVRAAGIAAAVELCRALLAAGAPGLHFYTLNRSTATREIYDALRSGTSEMGPDGAHG